MALAPRFFLEPWNVWVPVFAFALFLVLVWGLVCEHLALLPLAVAVGSHCVQTHISYTVLVAGLLGSVLVLAGMVVVAHRSSERASPAPLAAGQPRRP